MVVGCILCSCSGWYKFCNNSQCFPDLDKGIEPIIKVEKLVNNTSRKFTHKYRIDRNRRATLEWWSPIWEQWVFPLDFELPEDEEEKFT